MSNRRRHSKRILGIRTSGFTLVEIVVVLLILGTVTAVTVPAFRNTDGRDDVRKAAAEVRHVLDRARATARANGHAVSVTIDPASGRYWVDRPALTGTLALGGASIVSDGPRPRVTFHAAGAASAPMLAVQGGGRAHAIRIDPFTGQVDVQ
jgi:general secretion pathway protein H